MVDFDYKAFISYSHRDSRWAQWLLQALETYRIPPDLLPAGADRKGRGVGRIFRDRDEASAASDLKDEIQRALSTSENLIIIASPSSARSKYVEAEIQAFAEANARRATPGRILTLIVEGEPNVTVGAESNPLECFPPALRGGLKRPDGGAFEPLAADARPVGDGRLRALAKLVAALLDIRYDALVRRDLIRRRRQRMLALAASIAALAIAAIVSAVIISGNIEQDRLRTQEAAAQRDVRTVTAVQNASRAQQMLDGGDFTGAARLARTSLPEDGSLPFIPTANAVLYGSLFAQGSLADFDLGDFGFRTPLTMALGNGEYLAASDQGTAVIWSLATGVNYRRNDLGTAHSVAPGGRVAMFARGANGLVRFSADSRRWEDIDITGIQSPQSFVLLDDDTLAYCSGSRIVSADVDLNLVAHERTSATLDLPCYALAISSSGSLMLGVEGGIVESDLEGSITALYDSGRGLTPLWVWANEDYVYGAGAGGTVAFQREGGAPILDLQLGVGDEQLISPDGRFVVEWGSQLFVHDLEELTVTTLPCFCLFVDFKDAHTLVTMDASVLQAWDAKTLEPTETLFSFPSNYMAIMATRGVYLEDSDSYLIYRQLGFDTVVRLSATPNSTEVVNHRPVRDRLFVGAALARDGVLAYADRSLDTDAAPEVTLLRPTAVSDAGNPQFARVEWTSFETSVETDFLKLLGDTLIAIIDSSLDAKVGYHLGLFDASTGAKVLATDLEFLPFFGRDKRWAVLKRPGSISLFDVTRRTELPLPVPARSSWALRGDTLAIADNGRTLVYDLASGAPVPLVDQASEGVATLFCLSADGAHLVEARQITLDTTVFKHRALPDGKVLDSVQSDLDEESDAIVTNAATTVTGQEEVECDATRLVMHGRGSRNLVWTYDEDKVVPSAQQTPEELELPSIGSGPFSAEGLTALRLEWDAGHIWLLNAERSGIFVEIASGADRFSSVQYLADRGLVAAGLENGTFQVWDPNFPGAPIVSVAAHAAPVIRLDYDQPNGRVMSADGNGTIHVWPLLGTAKLLALTAP